jgi:archaellin
VLRSAHDVAAGAAVEFTAQAGVSLRLTASKPRVSRTRLSASYGYGPARGYYVTFTITVVNTGQQPVSLGPANFVLRVPGEGTVTSYQGNAPYSGASSQLDNTEVDPGQSLRAPMSFDVRHVHGQLEYRPDRSAAVIWRF